MDASQCRQLDMTCGRTGVALWCLPTLALFASAPMGDARWWIWAPSLTIMGAACAANAARCRRRHCYLTGPVFLAAAGLSLLRGAFHAGPSWNWISGVVILGWLLGWSLEQFFGSYVGRYS